ncbi:unnamed protein product [Phyllotreta striolata]|uniref:Uncharacterized protein n=1 Tax=Phyllotreta striolata TaxID=444603 RepID=A0A9N9TKM3_PHYSR|nr:unnamed protein product [Phyllotreta striolata]
MFSFKLKTADEIKDKSIYLKANVQDRKEYRNTLKTFQLSINQYLTELVNLDKTEENVFDDEDDESIESDDDGYKKPKRGLKQSKKICKLKKK